MSYNSFSSTIASSVNAIHELQAAKKDLNMAKALALEKIDNDTYCSSEELWHPPGFIGSYGGQLVAQTLRAAWHTVPDGFHVHSLHNYFLSPGRADIPAVYQVKRVRDGQSFATRAVTCTQEDKAVVLCICSFTSSNNMGEDALKHQRPMPENLPDPEDLPTHMKRYEKLSADINLPEKYRKYLAPFLNVSTPIDHRDVHVDTAEELIAGRTEENQQRGQFFKTEERLPDNDPILHACSIVCASDRTILRGALRANGISGFRGLSMVASVDHSVWFHTPTRADEWLYYDIHSPRSHDGRATAIGYIYNQEGILVATCVQEGILRLIGSQKVPVKPMSTKL